MCLYKYRSLALPQIWNGAGGVAAWGRKGGGGSGGREGEGGGWRNGCRASTKDESLARQTAWQGIGQPRHGHGDN